VTFIIPRDKWLERFATQLLLLRPQLSALEAARVAMEKYEEAHDFEPEIAAAMYADGATDNDPGG
jgi:hypothetical protein